MIGDTGGRYRFFCGLPHPGPWFPRYSRTNGDGYRPRLGGGFEPDYQWHPGRLLGALLGVREVWTCRRSKDHWMVNLVPSREVFKMTNVVDWTKVEEKYIPHTRREKVLVKMGVEPRNSKIPRPVVTQELRPHQTRAYQLGHRYYFNRPGP